MSRMKGVRLCSLFVYSAVILTVDCTSTSGWTLQQVGLLVQTLVEQHLAQCHLMLLTSAPHSPVFSAIHRHMHQDHVLLSIPKAVPHLGPVLLGEHITTCRGVIVHLEKNTGKSIISHQQLGDNRANGNNLISLLDRAGLSKLPHARVVIVGGKREMEAILLHRGFRNTIYSLYLAIQDYSAAKTTRVYPGLNRHLNDSVYQLGNLTSVSVYRRCMYCRDGEASVMLLQNWNTSFIPFHAGMHQEEQLNFMGRSLRIVTVPYFPYMNYLRVEGQHPGSPVEPLDSIDFRIIKTLTKKLNFTYRIYAEPNRSFGEEKPYGFTGMIGQLQREESDLSTIVAPTPGRLRAVDYLRTYPSDPLTLTSLKPTVLPAHTSLVRPFTTEVWLGIMMGMVIWCVTLWGFQRVWKWSVADTTSTEFLTALLYGSSALLQTPSRDPSISVSAQMLVGFWLVFCLVVSSSYKSSLIAHLTVLSTSQPLDSFEDLLQREGWQWIIEPWLFKGATLEYFSKHRDPVVQQVHKEMKVMVADKALAEVRKGGFTLIDHKNYIKVVVATHYTDSRGQTPFYISNEGISVLATFGWGLRKGAPFFEDFLDIIHRLEDAGIIEYWTDDTIYQRVREEKSDTAVDESSTSGGDTEGEEREVVLGLNHLQGAFYLLFLGSVLASIILCLEAITGANTRKD